MFWFEKKLCLENDEGVLISIHHMFWFEKMKKTIVILIFYFNTSYVLVRVTSSF